MSARGRGKFYVKKLTEADKGGGGVKIDQILADVICERSLIKELHISETVFRPYRRPLRIEEKAFAMNSRVIT